MDGESPAGKGKPTAHTHTHKNLSERCRGFVKTAVLVCLKYCSKSVAFKSLGWFSNFTQWKEEESKKTKLAYIAKICSEPSSSSCTAPVAVRLQPEHARETAACSLPLPPKLFLPS